MQFDFHNQKLLIIDDEPTNLQVIADFMKNQGITLIMTDNGPDGIVKAKSELPDLILLDVMMPEMDGYETCYQLKRDASTKKIPIIFMTALTELDDKLKAFAVGAVDYLSKPILEPELLARVCVHVKLYTLMQEIEGRSSRLVQALDVSNVVNVAVGIVMERHNIGQQEAFNAIRSKARSQQRKIDDVAEEMLSSHKCLNLWPKEK